MVEYRVCEYRDCPRELFHFRYKIYVEELGRRQTYANHDLRTIEDSLDSTGHQGIAIEKNKIIGTVRLNLLREGGVGFYHHFYELDRLPQNEQMTASVCTRYMVAQQHRKTRVPLELLKLIYLFGIENGSTACYMDTNEPFIPMYLKFGYEALFEKEHPDYGHVTVMRLRVLDLDNLRSVRSPFAPICERFLKQKSEPTLA